MSLTYLFCDSSFDPQHRHGFAAFLECHDLAAEPTIDAVRLTFFSDTNNTRLELQGVLLALGGLADGTATHVFTDCANIPNLLERKERLQSAQFHNRKGRPLQNADLYQLFFAECRRLELTFHWLQGQTPASESAVGDRIFALVDKAARQKLRSYNKAHNLTR